MRLNLQYFGGRGANVRKGGSAAGGSAETREESTTRINPEWGAYDKTVAQTHMDNYGEIFLDEYGAPIDNEYDADAAYENKYGSIITTDEIVNYINSMNKQQLEDAVDRIYDDGSWYTEDKRRKRQNLLEIVKYNYDGKGYENSSSRMQIMHGVFGTSIGHSIKATNNQVREILDKKFRGR